MNLNVPDILRKNAIDEWGKPGEQWLELLPRLLDQCSKLWDLELQPSSFELSYNYVTSVRLKDNTPAILKVGYPTEELLNEMKTLQLLDGRCSVRLLNSDVNLGALLLESINPGTPLTSVQREDDQQATIIAADLIKNYPVPVPEDLLFPTVEDWAEAFQRVDCIDGNPMPKTLLDKAKSIRRELEQERTQRALLHGDLHHANILLDAERGWISIDPKGVIGDPLFNAARFLINPIPDLIEMDSPEMVTERRLDILSSKLQADKQYLAAWAFVDCVMSACWWIESGGTTINFSLRCAEIIEPFMGV